ncbi:MAG TPA: cobalamin-binding protein [Verrucomicrobiae bacterium]|nr:cobalamin-binding protein [Verrucomicrobiae bacterium]
MPKPRIVSLLPACTEVVCGLGLEGRLVGRSHECDFPASVRRLPICTAPKINPESASAEIDRDVKALARQALSLYRVDSEQVRALKPDFILTQAQCAVCAVSLAEVEAAVAGWTGGRPRLISWSPSRLTEFWTELARVGEELGVAGSARELVRELKGRVADVIVKSAQVTRRPSVACIEWLDPLMAAGNWVPELVELAGGKNLFGEPGKHSPWLDWNALRERNPEILVVMPCGFDLARTELEMPALTSRLGWSKLRAVQRNNVCLTDGNAFFNRPGPRLVESLEILGEILQPGYFSFGHEGRGWRRFK